MLRENQKEINLKISKSLKGRNFFLTPEMSEARRLAGLKGALIQKEKKLKRPVKMWKDKIFLDITYGELEEYRKIHLVCEMCGSQPLTKRNAMYKNLVVDHDHDTGKFRGLLCVSCNRFLGYYENSKDFAEKYLMSRS